jgi:calcium-dependent protein kinase
MMTAQEGRVRGGLGVWHALKNVLGPNTAVKPVPTAGAGQHEGVHVAVVEQRELVKQNAEESQGLKRVSATRVEEKNRPEGGEHVADFGYARNMEKRFMIKDEIARGGNGVVYLVVDMNTGQEWALKSIPKVLPDDGSKNVSERKRLDHTQAIRREVDVLKRLRGCLNVASLEEVYEDDTHVHIVMEYCSGGELCHRIGAAHYSERTVASFMRATLRTLAQCHANGILHRDIKPGNFLLASEKEDAPLKAVDFGLAVFNEDMKNPRTDLGLEGTPWFMAPETLQSEVYASSDIWAAGIMAYQLLTGKFPFDDKTNPFNPSLSKIWKSILMDELKMSGSRWEGISDEAKDFVKVMLNKDPKQRPTAKEALKHPWLKGTIKERSSGSQLSLAVVQRIQRYSQSSVFKRSVLELIAEELLNDADSLMKASVNSSAISCPLGPDARPLIEHPTASPLEYLYERLRLVDKSLVDRSVLADGLREMGYSLTNEEVNRLLDQLDVGLTGKVGKAQLAASQIDWRSMQKNNTERWLSYARKAFSELDTDKDGVLSSEDMMALLRHKLPPAEVENALRHTLSEAARRRQEQSDDPSHHGSVDENSSHGGSHHEGLLHEKSLRDGMNFRQFLRMLHIGSYDSLDLYEDRLGSLGSPDRSKSGEQMMSPASFESVDKLLEKSVKGGSLLYTVSE